MFFLLLFHESRQYITHNDADDRADALRMKNAENTQDKEQRKYEHYGEELDRLVSDCRILLEHQVKDAAETAGHDKDCYQAQ